MSHTKEREHQLAKDVAAAINSFAFTNKDFCEAMSWEHRTLQQLFTNLCVAWLNFCGSDDYPHDPRNAASHKLGKRFKELEVRCLPMI